MTPWDVLHSSNRQNWRTPIEFFSALSTEFDFEIDAAADAESALCEKYYTESDSGLDADWSTSPDKWVFVNPPYGRAIPRWVDKAIAEKRKGARVVMLLFASTDTRWFERAWSEASEIRFYTGRLRFINPENPGLNSPAPKGSCVFVFDAARRGRVVTLCDIALNR